jgi:phage tail-like protein
MPVTLGPMRLSNNRNFEIQRLNHFEVIFDGFTTDFTLCVESCPLPNTANEVIELAYGNSKVKVAGVATFDNFDIVIKDAIGLDIEMMLYNWRRRVYDVKTDQIGWAVDYKRNGKINLFAPDGSCTRTWQIVGAWPTNFTPGDLSYESNEKRNISMSISIDKAWPGDMDGISW